MTTTQTGARFTLDEDLAREWIARAIASEEAAEDLPDIDGSYRASEGTWAYATAQLVDLAQSEGIITDAQPAETPALAWEFIPAGETGGHAHRWILNTGPGTIDDRGELITVTYPAAEDMWAMGLGPDSREIAGAPAALAVLTMAVEIGNDLARRLDDYIAALPLALRAPEIGRLLHSIRTEIEEPGGSWNGGDTVALLCEWFTALGYDIG